VADARNGYALIEYLRQIATADRLEELQAVLRAAPRRLVGAQGATFVLRDGDRVFYADEDAASPLWKGQRFPLEDCISGWAMLHSQTAVVPDIHEDARIPQAAYRPTFVRSLVMTPIGHPSIAALGCYWDHVRYPSDADVALLHAVADAAAEAIDRIGLDGAPVAPTLAE